MPVETLAAPSARAPSREDEEHHVFGELGITPAQVHAWRRLHGRDQVQHAIADQVFQRLSVDTASAGRIASDAIDAGDQWALRNPVAAFAAVVDERRQQAVRARAEAATAAILKQVATGAAQAGRAQEPIARASRSQVGTAHRATRAARTRTARRTAAGASSASRSRSGGDDDSGEADEPPERPGENGGPRRSPRRVEREEKLQAAIALLREFCKTGCDSRLVKREAKRRGISDWHLRLAREKEAEYKRSGRRHGHGSHWTVADPGGSGAAREGMETRFDSRDFIHPEAAAFLNRRDELLERWRNRPLGRAMGGGE